MVAIRRNEHLSLVPQPPKGDRMDQAVAIALENVARPARSIIVFGIKTAARTCRIGGELGEHLHSTGSGAILSDSELVNLNASIPTVSRSSAKVAASGVPRNGPMISRARSALLATYPGIPSKMSGLRSFMRAETG